MNERTTMTIPEIVRASPVRVSEATIRRAIRDRRLPVRLLFGKYRVSAQDLEKFIQGKPAGAPTP